MTIKLVQLKGFCAIMQSEDFSITKTAEKIYLEHSALSRQLSSLEEELGVSLFNR